METLMKSLLIIDQQRSQFWIGVGCYIRFHLSRSEYKKESEQETIVDHWNVLTTWSNNADSIRGQVWNCRVHVWTYVETTIDILVRRKIEFLQSHDNHEWYQCHMMRMEKTYLDLGSIHLHTRAILRVGWSDYGCRYERRVTWLCLLRKNLFPVPKS